MQIKRVHHHQTSKQSSWLTSLSISNHLHASSSGNMRKMERIKVRKELSQLLPAEQLKLIRRDELPHMALTREHIALLVGAMQCKPNLEL